MWFSKNREKDREKDREEKDREKDREEKNREKGIVIPAEGTFQLPLPPVRFDRDKCFVRINGNETLLGEEGFIAEIKAGNTKPIRIKIFPDFKNRKLDAVEIIDVDDNKKYPKDGPQLKFVGLGAFSREDIERHINNIKRYIDKLDEDILKSNKRSRRISYMAIIILSIMTIIQSYFAYVLTGISRYINIVLIMINISGIYVNMWLIKRTNKIDRDINQRSDKSGTYIDQSKENMMIKSSEMKKAKIVKEK